MKKLSIPQRKIIQQMIDIDNGEVVDGMPYVFYTDHAHYATVRALIDRELIEYIPPTRRKLLQLVYPHAYYEAHFNIIGK